MIAVGELPIATDIALLEQGDAGFVALEQEVVLATSNPEQLQLPVDGSTPQPFSQSTLALHLIGVHPWLRWTVAGLLGRRSRPAEEINRRADEDEREAEGGVD
jgi:hypothetical protein